MTLVNISGGSNGIITGMTNLVSVFNDSNFGGSVEVNILGLSVPIGTNVTNLLNDLITGTVMPVSGEHTFTYYILSRKLNIGGTRGRLTSGANGSNAPNVVPAISDWPSIGTFNGGNLTLSGGPTSGTGMSANLTISGGMASGSGTRGT